MSFQDKNISINADWTKVYTASELKADLPNLNFRSKAGWYFTKTDTVLVTYAGPITGTKFYRNKKPGRLYRVYVWNRPAVGAESPCEIFNSIMNAPVQHDDR